MQPEEEHLDVGEVDSSTGSSFQEQHRQGPGSEGRRIQRAAAAKATDRGKRIAEMILECNEDGEDAGGDGTGGGGRGGASGSDAAAAGEGGGEGSAAGDAGDEFGEDDYDGGGNGSLYRRKPMKTRWSAAEDAQLKKLVDSNGTGNWRVVSDTTDQIGYVCDDGLSFFTACLSHRAVCGLCNVIFFPGFCEGWVVAVWLVSVHRVAIGQVSALRALCLEHEELVAV